MLEHSPSVPRLLVWLLVWLATQLSGCAPEGSPGGGSRTMAVTLVTPFEWPPESARALALDPQNLVLSVVLDPDKTDAQTLTPVQLGQDWVVSFNLPAAGMVTLQVLWGSREPELTLATLHRTFDTASTSALVLTPSDYTLPDQDNDEVSNFDELRLGFDWSSAASPGPELPGANQTDCRDIPALNPPLELRRNAVLKKIAGKRTTDIELNPLASSPAFTALVLWVLEPGAVSITHLAGGPEQTQSFLFSTTTGPSPGDVVTIGTSEETDARASVSSDAVLAPGLYCYRLQGIDLAALQGPLSIEIDFNNEAGETP